MTIKIELSLEKTLKFRLIKHLTFFANELEDYESFRSLSWKEYNEERNKRRDVERWIENILNSSIDIAKIILTSETLILPDTYRETVASISLVAGFNKENIEKISQWVKLRNIISHEYLDVRWSSIKRFISETEPLFKDFLNIIKEYLERKTKEDEGENNI